MFSILKCWAMRCTSKQVDVLPKFADLDSAWIEHFCSLEVLPKTWVLGGLLLVGGYRREEAGGLAGTKAGGWRLQFSYFYISIWLHNFNTSFCNYLLTLPQRLFFPDLRLTLTGHLTNNPVIIFLYTPLRQKVPKKTMKRKLVMLSQLCLQWHIVYILL